MCAEGEVEPEGDEQVRHLGGQKPKCGFIHKCNGKQYSFSRRLRPPHNRHAFLHPQMEVCRIVTSLKWIST